MTNFLKRFFWIAVALCACTTTDKQTPIEIQRTGGATAGKVSISDEIEVELGGTVLRSETKRSDKRKYYNSANSMIYAVKMDDDGFKLRDSQEKLLWKIKLYPDKVKIADNEEMSGAYELKLKEEGRLKLERNDQEVTQIRLMENSEYTVGAYLIKGVGLSLSPGVLLIPEISEEHKVMIMAELLFRKR